MDMQVNNAIRQVYRSVDNSSSRFGERAMSEDEPQPSTSADTIRHLPPLHISFSTEVAHTSSKPVTSSQPSSPRSSLPSPSSPSGDSVSSLPSVSSSFLFSSGPTSPPHLGQHAELAPEHGHGDSSLIIPSLTLPSPLRRPTPYGQGLGQVRLLVLGRQGQGTASVLEAFTDAECEDVVDVGHWEMHDPAVSFPAARSLKVSTDWIEHRDPHGLEKHEPSRNVELVHLPEYRVDDDPDEVINGTLKGIHSAFRTVLSVVHPEQPPSDLLATLLSSSATPLYTAMVLILSQPLLPLEHTLIADLSTHIPLIVLPPLQELTAPAHSPQPYARPRNSHNDTIVSRRTLRRLRLSSLQPPSALALRNLIFRQPEALATLRLEAVDRFLRWREVERAVGRLLGSSETVPYQGMSASQCIARGNIPDKSASTTGASSKIPPRIGVRWDKARWEAEWEDALSLDVAKTVRSRRITERRTTADYFSPATPIARSTIRHHTPFSVIAQDRETVLPLADTPNLPSFDPLHLPSVFAFSLSLLSPLKDRIVEVLSFSPISLRKTTTSSDDKESALSDAHRPVGHSVGGWALAGAFCTGVGVGFILARW